MNSSKRPGWSGFLVGAALLGLAALTFDASSANGLFSNTSFGHWCKVVYPNPTRPTQMTSNGGMVMWLLILGGVLSIVQGFAKRSAPQSGWDV